MNGYVARKGNRWYAVIYEGLDPVTGREIRRWHPAGTDKADAEKLARRLARELNGPDDRGRSLSFGAYLTETWLPAKRIELPDDLGRLPAHRAPPRPPPSRVGADAAAPS